MKNKKSELQLLIKNAILEALTEFTSGRVMMTSENPETGEVCEYCGKPAPCDCVCPECGSNSYYNGHCDMCGYEDRKKDPLEPPVIWPPAGF